MSSIAPDSTPQRLLTVQDYDLDATLASGQAFGWTRHRNGWTGAIGNRWVSLSASPGGIAVRTASDPGDWAWLLHYLQAEVVLQPILDTFPKDPAMTDSIADCRGLRLLRQDPWECLASFILSSTKQILQIQQICALLRERFGRPLVVPDGEVSRNSFPSAAAIAASSETELRACKMGFRAPSLLQAAQAVSEGRLALEALQGQTLEQARESLCSLRGVGPKIANCVLLFAYGFPGAFPVDVWVLRALRELYFPRRHPSAQRLERFVRTHFGPNAGYAQQYLFHFIRQREGRVAKTESPSQSRSSL